MKYLLIILLLLFNKAHSQVNVDSLNKLKVGIDMQPKKYKRGFVYWNRDCALVTLWWWEKVDKVDGVNIHRWMTKINLNGKSSMGWVDEQSIDADTQKLNK